MPSPFPGMDPHLESHDWEDFHTRFITAFSDAITPEIQPEYLVRVERRIYVEHLTDDDSTHSIVQPDIAILTKKADVPSGTSRASEPCGIAVECKLPIPIERREAYLVIRDRESMEVVTVIELLSPANKRRRSRGRREYLRKRDQFIASYCNLVEIDLLRGGEPLPVVGKLPPGDYHAIVSRYYRRPSCAVYCWNLRQPLPKIPIPLQEGDEDVVVDLQQLFTTVYDRARYDLSIDYASQSIPLPTEENS